MFSNLDHAVKAASLQLTVIPSQHFTVAPVRKRSSFRNFNCGVSLLNCGCIYIYIYILFFTLFKGPSMSLY